MSTPDLRTIVDPASLVDPVPSRAIGLGFEHVVRIGTYIVVIGEARVAVVGEALRRAWGERLPAQTMIGVQRLALPEMRFEIDAVAVRP